MLSRKLQLLDKRINEIDQMKPIDFLSEALHEFHEEEKETADQIADQLQNFSDDLNHLLSQYQRRGISAERLSCEFYNVLLYYVRKTVIFSYARKLGIRSKLFKNQMDFLFKGKS